MRTAKVKTWLKTKRKKIRIKMKKTKTKTMKKKENFLKKEINLNLTFCFKDMVSNHLLISLTNLFIIEME